MRKAALLFALLFTGYISMAQDEVEIKLYKKIPGEIRSNNYVEKINTRANGTMWAEKSSEPTLKFFRPEESVKTNTAVIICPGGGYAGLALSHEGYDVAKKFAELGVSAFVLRYRLPSDEIMKDRKIGPLQDAQQAIKYIRENASKYGIDVNKIGVMGFSAGGHLASTASTQFRRQVIDNKENTSLRPDFSILLYPVITFGEFTHKGSRKNLIGDHATQELIDLYSSEKQVTRSEER